MIRSKRFISLLPALILLNAGMIGIVCPAAADEPPPSGAPANDGTGRRHNPAWAACKKQADDQKLTPGDARRDFMKNCLNSAHGSAPTAP